MAQAIPAGYPGVTAYLILNDAACALDFYVKAFGAEEVLRIPGPDGKIGHAEIKISGGHVMLADETPGSPYRSAQSLGGSPVTLMFYVPDVDARFAHALAAGAKVERAVADQFYGDRSGTLTDPFGYTWTIATHTEDVSEAELQRRMAAMGHRSSAT
jgi:PhnB protein